MHTLLSAVGCSRVSVPHRAGRAVSGACISTGHILSKTGKLPALRQGPTWLRYSDDTAATILARGTHLASRPPRGACSLHYRSQLHPQLLRCPTTFMLSEQIRGEQHAFAVQSPRADMRCLNRI